MDMFLKKEDKYFLFDNIYIHDRRFYIQFDKKFISFISYKNIQYYSTFDSFNKLENNLVSL